MDKKYRVNCESCGNAVNDANLVWLPKDEVDGVRVATQCDGLKWVCKPCDNAPCGDTKHWSFMADLSQLPEYLRGEGRPFSGFGFPLMVHDFLPLRLTDRGRKDLEKVNAAVRASKDSSASAEPPPDLGLTFVLQQVQRWEESMKRAATAKHRADVAWAEAVISAHGDPLLKNDTARKAHADLQTADLFLVAAHADAEARAIGKIVEFLGRDP